MVSCSTYIQIDSRGTNYSLGELGIDAAAFQNDFLIRHRGDSLRTEINTYFPSGDPPLLVNGQVSVGKTYAKSVGKGEKWLVKQLTVDTKACPDARILLTGYSEGAQVTADVYQAATPALRSHVLAVVLFSDPYFNSADTVADQPTGVPEGGFVPGVDGALAGVFGQPRPLFAPDTYGHVFSFCHHGDPVCQGDPLNVFADNWTNYGTDYHEDYFNYDPYNAEETISDHEPPAVTSVTPGDGPVGTTVLIKGLALAGTSTVTLNGTAIPFQVHSNREITVTLPSGATSGPLEVTTSGGTAGLPFTLDQAGSLLWVKNYAPSGNETAKAIVMSPDGSKIFVTGWSAFYGIATVAYDTRTGAQLWDEKADLRSQPAAIAISPDGKTVYVLGSSGDDESHFTETFAYDAQTGAQLWKAVHRAAFANAIGLAVSPDSSTVFVTGAEYKTASGDPDGMTIAYSAADGSELWFDSLSGTAGSTELTEAIAVSPDGSSVFALTGSSSNSDLVATAYKAADGTILWRAGRGKAPKDFAAQDITVSPDGSKIYVTGSGTGKSKTPDFMTAAYAAATGAQLWVAVYSGPAKLVDDADKLVLSPDGTKLFVTGGSASLGDGTGTFASTPDYATVAYNAATGKQLWAARYDGTWHSYDFPHGIAVSADGTKIYVSGLSYGIGTQTDYVTVAYDSATGGQAWLQRYDGSLHDADEAVGVVVAPDGSRVFVAGDAGGGHEGYATVAYDSG